jgi:phospholipid transport system substrate-binding protein
MPKTATAKECRPMTIRISAASALTLMVLALGVALPGRGMAAQDPQAVISYVGTHGMAAVGPDVSPAQRIAQLRELLQDYFDVPGTAAFALGRYRSRANPQQQQEYLGLYRDYTVHAYDTQLGQYGAAPFHVTGSRSDGEQTVVTSEILRSGGSRVQIDWYLVNRRGDYKITDLSIGGISVKVTQRDEFARWIQNNGGRFDALLAVLRQQTGQVR